MPRTAEGRLDEDAWHALRREDVTASDVGALFQVHQRTTALGLYADKTQGPAGGDSQAARRGRVLEHFVAAELALRWGDAAAVEKAADYLRGRDPADEHMRVGSARSRMHAMMAGVRSVVVIGRPLPRGRRARNGGPHS